MVAADGRTGFSWSHRRLQLQYRPCWLRAVTVGGSWSLADPGGSLARADRQSAACQEPVFQSWSSCICHSDRKRGRPRAPDVPRHSITRHHQPWTLREPLRARLSSQVALAPSPDLGRGSWWVVRTASRTLLRRVGGGVARLSLESSAAVSLLRVQQPPSGSITQVPNALVWRG
jgi:hypothetical protein